MRFAVPGALLAFLFVGLNTAMPWLEPIEIPTGLMAAIGFSPLPIEVPGLGLIPKELLRKQNSVLYPPPNNWCGFVGGNPADVLSCVATKTCVYSGVVLGCCDQGLIATCTNLFTTCANYGDGCNSACQANYNILKCSNAAMPYCRTFAFDAGTRLYNRDSTAGFARTVEFLADYYLTAIGSQVLASSFGPISVTAASQSIGGGGNQNSAAATSASGTAINNVDIQTNPPTSTPTSGSSSSNSNQNANSSSTTTHSGLGTGAIVGIVVGILVVLLAITAALIAWCLIRRRRRKRADLAPSQIPPQMQQHQQHQQPPQAQAQAPTYPPQQPTYPSTQQSYFDTFQQQQKPPYNTNTHPLAEAGAGTVAGGVGAGYYGSHSGTDGAGAGMSPPLNGPPRYSVAGASQSANPPALSSSDMQGDYYKAPTSPTATEVEGSGMGSPGFVSPLTTGGGGGEVWGAGGVQGQGQGGHGGGYGQGGHGEGGAYEVSGSGRNAGPAEDVYEMPDQRR